MKYDSTPNLAISQFEVLYHGKVKETFPTYEQATTYAKQYRGAIVRYYIKPNSK